MEGKTYYLDNVYLGINHVTEFLDRYEELAIEGTYKELSLPYEGYLIYLEYWKKHLGIFSKNLYKEALRF